MNIHSSIRNGSEVSFEFIDFSLQSLGDLLRKLPFSTVNLDCLILRVVLKSNFSFVLVFDFSENNLRRFELGDLITGVEPTYDPRVELDGKAAEKLHYTSDCNA